MNALDYAFCIGLAGLMCGFLVALGVLLCFLE